MQFDPIAGYALNATPPWLRQPGYPSPKAVGAISSRFQVQIRRMLLEGNPVIVANDIEKHMPRLGPTVTQARRA